MPENRKLAVSELGRPGPDQNLTQSKRPITIILDNIRSGLNVGSMLRTADAFGIEELVLCGITAQPPDRQVLKASIGAESSVKWRYEKDTEKATAVLKDTHRIVIVEQTLNSIQLHELQWDGRSPIALIFGNELRGVNDSLLPLADECVEIPQVGHKHSLNVAVCAGVALWELCRLSAD